jgi:hypothetical protein
MKMKAMRKAKRNQKIAKNQAVNLMSYIKVLREIHESNRRLMPKSRARKAIYKESHQKVVMTHCLA